MRSPWRSFSQFVRDDSMSIALFALFGACAALQSVAGWLAYREMLLSLHHPTISWSAYLVTGDFLDGMLSNWQAAVLQLAVLIAFGSVLRQKGAAHSKREEGGHPTAASPRTVEWKLRPRRSWAEWLHANSMSMVFFTLFAVTLIAHALFGQMKHNETQALLRLPGASLSVYLGSADFWNSLMQTWEAEFFAAGVYIVLSIFLRQESSPQSKPVNALNSQTGQGAA